MYSVNQLAQPSLGNAISGTQVGPVIAFELVVNLQITNGQLINVITRKREILPTEMLCQEICHRQPQMLGLLS